MRRTLIAVAVVVLPASSVMAAPDAHACGCTGVEPPTIRFEGTAIEAIDGLRVEDMDVGRVWKFRVDQADLGTTNGADVRVKAFEGTSCQSGPSPEAGAVYRVTAYGGNEVAGQPLFYGGGCGGSIDLVRSDVPGADPSPRDEPRNRSMGVGVLIAGLLVATTGAAALAVKLRQRRS